MKQFYMYKERGAAHFIIGEKGKNKITEVFFIFYFAQYTSFKLLFFLHSCDFSHILIS